MLWRMRASHFLVICMSTPLITPLLTIRSIFPNPAHMSSCVSWRFITVAHTSAPAASSTPHVCDMLCSLASTRAALSSAFASAPCSSRSLHRLAACASRCLSTGPVLVKMRPRTAAARHAELHHAGWTSPLVSRSSSRALFPAQSRLRALMWIAIHASVFTSFM